MAYISRSEFERLCKGIRTDRETIIKHNPIGSEEETLLWMLMSVLVSYLSLEEKEIPCFPGDINSDTYKNAILFILESKSDESFDPEPFLEEMLS